MKAKTYTINWQHAHLDSPVFQGLTGPATKVLLCMLNQLDVEDDGDDTAIVTATPSQLEPWDVRSKVTVSRAVSELLERKMIRRTGE